MAYLDRFFINQDPMQVKNGCNIKLIITELCVELQIVANKFVKLIFYNDTS